MSLRDRRRGQQRAYTAIALFLAFIMGASLLVPLFSNNLATTNPNLAPTEAPTARPTATVPPAPDTSTITFTQAYLHPTGLFTAAVPSGWEVGTEINNESEAQVTMRNPGISSLVEARILEPTIDIASTTDLGQIFDENWLRSSWREYTSWNETTRRIDEDNNRLVIDFTLSRSGQQFIARQVAYTDGDWVYVVRAVTPSGAQYSNVLRHIIDNMAQTVQPIERYVGTPLAWNGYFDSEWHHLIRFPAAWQVVDAAPGLPASISSEGVTLRVEARELPLADAEAAEAFVAGLRPDIEVLSVEPIERDDATAYRVAYSQPTLDGPSESGVVLLVPGAEDMAHIANLRLNTSGVDFNSADAAETYADILNALETFALFPDLNVTGGDATA